MIDKFKRIVLNIHYLSNSIVITANSITVLAPTSQSSALPTTVPAAGSPTTSSATSKYSVELAHY